MAIKTLIVGNPFADYGKIVTGKRFVGRSDEIQKINDRVLGRNFGNLAIMGLPRIGKSSLVWNALIERRDELLREKTIVEYLSCGKYCSSEHFYRALIKQVFKAVKSCGQNISDNLESVISDFQQTKSTDELNIFFAITGQFGYKVIIVLDEFDHAKNIFRLEDFQFLRELSISPETQVCLVTVSRRSIQELEPEDGAISNFYGVFSDLYLKMFVQKDIDLYWKTCSENGLSFSKNYCLKVEDYVGRHPFWLDMFNFEVCSAIQNGQAKIPEELFETGGALRSLLWKNYDGIVDLMKEEGLKSHFVQAIVGPRIDLTQMSIERLLKYDLIKQVSVSDKSGCGFETLIQDGLVKTSDSAYTSISRHMDEYMGQKEAEYEIWPLWNETERLMRKLILHFLRDKFGDPWREKFLSCHKEKSLSINRMEEMMVRSEKTFGNRASKNLVDYTYPMDMWDCFVTTDWGWFQKVLSGQKADWREKFVLLAKVRNPIAHSNSDFIVEQDYYEARGICEEISRKIGSFFEFE